MATQAAIFGETIAGMKKALKRKAYDSDSDSSIEHLTNRGNKLRKKARYVHEGQLAAPTGPQVYKRVRRLQKRQDNQDTESNLISQRIEHAGYYRDVISFNPPLIDEDGYEVDSDDDDERVQVAVASAAEFDPYAEVRIEHLLAPLTAASDLPHHPTLSKPFLSKTLTELTDHAREMVQKEKASLWRIKHLLTRLSGDNTWIPCESVETEHDFNLFLDERDRPQLNLIGKGIARDGDQLSTGTLASEDEKMFTIDGASAENASIPTKQVLNKPANDDVVMASTGEPENIGDSGRKAPGDPTNGVDSGQAQGGPNSNKPAGEDLQIMTGGSPRNPVDTRPSMEIVERLDQEEGAEDPEEPAPRRMRTRAQAQAASDNTASSRARSISPDFGEETFIHPYFLAPLSSRPDRDQGLPQHEADDIRKLLQLYIQKQEEVCRGVQKVYDGLLRADRYRKLVMKWAKSEGHVGVNRDMSDGEDWYDKEEWGLDEDLKKGQDEEEEDAATTAKKTRTRRQ